MVSKLSGFQEYVGLWNVKTFPQSTTTGHLNHIKREVDELESELKLMVSNPCQNVRNVAEEAADIFILLLSIAHRFEFDLMVAAADKMRTLQSRSWNEADKDGVFTHITED